MIRTVKTLILGALVLAVVAFGQTQERSVRAGLAQRGALAAWKVQTPIVPIPDLKLERTQMYAVSLKQGAANTELSLMLGANGKNAFAHYAAIIYGGAATREAGVAHGYLTSLVAQDCIGLDQATMGRVRGLMDGVIKKLKNVRVSDTLNAGPFHAEASASFENNRLSVVMILERSDAPGKTWGTYCGFEK
jgi:hypothetical protein